MFLLSLYAGATNMSYYNVRLYRAAKKEPHRAEGEARIRGETVISSLSEVLAIVICLYRIINL